MIKRRRKPICLHLQERDCKDSANRAQNQTETSLCLLCRVQPILFKDSANRANQYAKTASNETGTYCRHFNRYIQMHSKHKTKLNKMKRRLSFGHKISSFHYICKK